MADMILTQIQIENFFRALTCTILGIPTSDGEAEINAGRVRIGWPKDGAPAWSIDEDVIIIKITLANDSYAKLVESVYSSTAEGMTRADQYTRVHIVDWVFYGPNSYTDSDKLRNGLFNQNIVLAQSNLYLITDVPIPIRNPDYFDGQWWSRVDLSASFNEKVKRESEQQTIASLNIKIKTEGGIEQDVNFTD